MVGSMAGGPRGKTEGNFFLAMSGGGALAADVSAGGMPSVRCDSDRSRRRGLTGEGERGWPGLGVSST